LAGEVVDWEGAATGPKGAGLAQQVGADGLISVFEVVPAQRDFKRAVVATVGTVVDEGEDLAGERVRLAVGAPWAATYHFVYTAQGADTVREMPGGSAWVDVIDKVPNACATCTFTRATWWR
jgi:5,10-methylenetetrahydromethanopterin reductase